MLRKTEPALRARTQVHRTTDGRFRNSSQSESIFCPVKSGAMKCTNNTNEWIHVMCALWHHDHVTIGDKVTMSNISCKNDFLNSEKCSICNQKSGLTFECSKRSCKNRFHPICAWYGGAEMRITRVTSISKETEGKVRDGLRYVAYCSECSDCDLGLQQQIDV